MDSASFKSGDPLSEVVKDRSQRDQPVPSGVEIRDEERHGIRKGFDGVDPLRDSVDDHATEIRGGDEIVADLLERILDGRRISRSRVDRFLGHVGIMRG